MVVANLSGLARAMMRDGRIEDVSVLKEFALGFTQAKASFDFVDVGYGKERADSKIRGKEEKWRRKAEGEKGVAWEPEPRKVSIQKLT